MILLIVLFLIMNTYNCIPACKSMRSADDCYQHHEPCLLVLKDPCCIVSVSLGTQI